MEKLKVLSAYDEALIEELPMLDEKGVFSLLERSYALFQDRSKWIPQHKRIEILEKAASLLEERKEEFVVTSAKEGGKPYMDTLVEVNRAIDGIRVAVKELLHFGGHEIAMNMNAASAGHMAYTLREPRGVIFSISAFNHPVNLIVHQVVPAIAVGAPVIVKPSRSTPLSCRNLLNVLYDAGLPKEWAEMALCSGSVAEKVVQDTRVSFVSFIGSSRVGWHLRSKLAPGAGIALEHGGSAPVVFDRGADIDGALPGLIKAGFYHAGQVCVSVQRVYVHEKASEEFVTKYVDAAKKLNVGDPVEKDTEVGPIISRKEVDRVHDWVQKAAEDGGKILCGGKKMSDTCYEPTVILNPPDDSLVSQKEVFGPVVIIYTYKDRDEAIRRANDVPFSFQAAVYTKDIDFALEAVKKLNGTAVMVNEHTAFRVDWMPFYGHKDSGIGVGGIRYSMEDMSIEKMMVIKSPAL